MKNVLWLIAVLASGAVGFYVGIGYGAKSMGAIVAQNEVADGLARVREALSALQKADISVTNASLELNLKSALFQIGTYSQGLAHWKCTESDRGTIEAASAYVSANPDLLNGPTPQLGTQALAFCNKKGDAQPGGT